MDVGNKLIDINNVDEEGLLDDILTYCIYLEAEDSASTIERSPNDGKHVTSETIIKQKEYKWEDDEDLKVTNVVVDDRKKEIVNKFYFGGESDSSQTTYETLLNNLKVCTKSTNEDVGKILLVLLRIVLDKRLYDGYIISHLEAMNDESKYIENRTIGGRQIPTDNFFIWEICEYLSKTENYSFTHDLRDGVYVEQGLSGYKGKTKIIRFIGDVDIYDLYRIRDALGLTSPDMRYDNIKK